jgi:hypothetical protein
VPNTGVGAGAFSALAFVRERRKTAETTSAISTMTATVPPKRSSAFCGSKASILVFPPAMPAPAFF